MIAGPQATTLSAGDSDGHTLKSKAKFETHPGVVEIIFVFLLLSSIVCAYKLQKQAAPVGKTLTQP
jgi:hypothetical protein